MKKLLVYFLVVVLAYGPSFSAYAAYGRLSPPPGWSPGTSASVSTFRYAAAASATSTILGRINANAALTVAGSAYAVPVGLKLGVTAAAKAAEYSFGNPYLFLFALGAPFLYQWYQEHKLEVVGNQWKKFELVQRTDLEYSIPILSPLQWYPTKLAACQAGIATKAAPGSVVIGDINEGCFVVFINSSGMTYSQFSTSINSRASQVFDKRFFPIELPEFKQIMIPKPIPDQLPKLLPDFDWPVESPVVNPDPVDKTKPTPIWLPTGDPVKNPSVQGTPDSWTQPGVRVTPSPTVDDPWRVDITPDPLTKGDPSPNTSPGAPAPGTTPPKAEKIEIETCGLPGKPKCQIDELTTKPDAGTTFDASKTELNTQKDAAKAEIDKAAMIQAPSWTFAFNLPTGCSPFPTGLRGVVIDMCQYQATIHNLMSMIWAGATAFCLIGMVGRTIRES